MPTKRTPRTRAPTEDVTETEWAKMMDEPHDDPEWYVPREVWDAHRDDVLRLWVGRNPGTRPDHWWRYDAPELRQRLGGTGQTMQDVFPAMTPTYQWGLPAMWITREYAFKCGEPKLVKAAIDASDPPRFESQAAYLARLSLFFEGERARVKKAEFNPVPVE